LTFFRRLGEFIERRRLLIFLSAAALLVIAGIGAQRVEMATGVETFLGSNSQVYKDYLRFSEDFGGDPVIVLLEGDDLLQLLEKDNLQKMQQVETRMRPEPEQGLNPNVKTAISPPTVLQLAWQQQTGSSELPDDPQALYQLVVDPGTEEIRPQFRSAFPDSQHALISVIPVGNLDMDEEEAVGEDVFAAVDEADLSALQPRVTGWPVMAKEMNDMMSSGLRNTLIISTLLMLAVLVLIFNVRGRFLRRWLPLLTVVLATIYTFGLMGWLSIPLTMISMSIFPIMIGLGVDYGIQFYNRYDEESRKGRSVAQAIISAVTHITPAVGTALITVCLAFAALFISPVPMIRDFGQMLLIGLVMCYLVALFVLLSIIYWRDRRSNNRRETQIQPEKVDSEEGGLRHWWLERWLRWFTPKVISRPAIIIPIALALTVLGWVADPHVGVETNEEEFINQNTPFMQNYLAVLEITKSLNEANVMVEAEDVLEPDILAWIWDRQQYVMSQESEYVANSSSISRLILQNNRGEFPQSSAEARAILENIPSLLKTNLVSDDFTAANISFGLRDITIDQTKVFNERLEEDVADLPPGTNIILTGWPVMGVELLDALTGGRWQITGLGVGLIFVALFFLFRRDILKAIMAIVPIGLIIGWSSGLMFLLGIKFTPLTATLGVLILGIGAEYTILVMSRYYEEKGKGEPPVVAMTTAMATIGRAVLVSGLTTIAGFAALLSATDFLILRDFGIVVMIDVAFALLSTIIVLPPLVVWLDGWRERRRLRRATAQPISKP